MRIEKFLVVGENIHCTRIFKVNGKNIKDAGGGQYTIPYRSDHGNRELPIPPAFTDGADWQAGNVKHCAVAIWQGNYGDAAGKAAGIDYLQALAKRQESQGATYLDINVDEFSTDIAERVRLMKWTVDVVQKAVKIPMSIDSSNLEILAAGLSACDPARGRPMVNSVSLERVDAIKTAARYKAVVIASAAGEKDMPSSAEERLANVAKLMPILKREGIDLPAIHIDPLVFPISVDAENGNKFMNAVEAIRKTYGPAIHIVAGLSNVSFGMPNRKLINQVYAWLAVQKGADGGIVDPAQISKDILNGLDPATKEFKLAADLLTGKDEFGMAYIEAFRGGEG